MSRPPFDVSLNGKVDITRPSGLPITMGAVVPNAKRATETSSGTSRHKPTGFIPPTGYALDYRSVSLAQGYCNNVTNKSNLDLGQKYTGTVGGSPGRFTSDSHFTQVLPEANIVAPGIENEVLIKLRTKLKGKKVDLAVAFAERKQTAMLVGDTAKRIASAYSELRKGHWRNSLRRLGVLRDLERPRGSTVTNQWLSMQYGWKPLLSDVFGSVEALNERNKDDWRVTVKARKSVKWANRVKYASTLDNGTGSARASISCFGRLDAVPKNEAIISLGSLGITNPLLVAWELVPYSFVVDWFLPIGDYLDSIDAMLGYGDAYTSISTFTKGEWVGNGDGRLDTGPNSYVDCQYVESKTIVKLVRNASSGVPLPTFPRLKDPRSLGHMANGLALLSQVFGR